jgi:WD40 repeat protein
MRAMILEGAGRPLREADLPVPGYEHYSPVVSVAFSSNGKLLISGSGDDLNDEPGEVLVWDIATRKSLKILTRNDEPVYAVAFSPNGKMMASSHNNEVKIWSTDSLKSQ